MTDIAESRGGAGRAWSKGATAQKGHVRKCSRYAFLCGMELGAELKSFSKNIFNLFFFGCGVTLGANPYTLEYSLTGTETVTLESNDYSVKAGWEFLPVQLPDVSYEVHPKVHAYIVLFTDILTGESAVLLTDGADMGGGWKKTGWFGYYFGELYPWVYHQNLGWIYVTEKSSLGAWFHHKRMGWVWTMPKVFPSLYMNDRAEWTFVDTAKMKTTLYDYAHKEWFEADTPLAILGGASPGNGGDIAGLGYYYRWSQVTLEARPSSNFNFGGWSGDLSGMEKISVFEAVRNMQVEASFIPLPTPEASAKEVVSGVMKALDKMENLTENEKKLSIVELLIFGKSPTSGLSIDGSE
jgi:hypothetical protein